MDEWMDGVCDFLFVSKMAACGIMGFLLLCSSGNPHCMHCLFISILLSFAPSVRSKTWSFFFSKFKFLRLLVFFSFFLHVLWFILQSIGSVWNAFLTLAPCGCADRKLLFECPSFHCCLLGLFSRSAYSSLGTQARLCQIVKGTWRVDVPWQCFSSDVCSPPCRASHATSETGSYFISI